MSITEISKLILEYRYWILVPLALIEGPIVAFIAGTLAALNYFNIYVLLILFFIRDVGLDACYYLAGHYGGKTAFIKRMLAKIDVMTATWSRFARSGKRGPFVPCLSANSPMASLRFS